MLRALSVNNSAKNLYFWIIFSTPGLKGRSCSWLRTKPPTQSKGSAAERKLLFSVEQLVVDHVCGIQEDCASRL